MTAAASQSDALRPVTVDVIGCRQAGTLWGLFCERVRRSPDRVAYRDYDPASGRWRDHTWRAMAARVDRFRSAFAREALKPADTVAVLLPNGIDWVCFDMAAHAAGLIVVGLYPHDTAANNAYILGHAEAHLLLLDSEAQWKAFEPYGPQLARLASVWIRNPAGEGVASPSQSVRSLPDILADETAPPPPEPVAPEAVATLIYTSGTTGRPKGVMLSHFALLWNAEAATTVVTPLLDDIFLSILPLAHAFERTVGYYLPMMGGCTVAYSRSPRELREDLLAVRPTAMLAVPLLFERMSAAVWANVESSLVKRVLLRLAAALGWRRFEATRRGSSLGPIDRLLWPLLQRIVATPVMAAFGGRLRVAINGGAPLDQRVARFLIGLGLPVVEGYGLTEAAPVVAANSIEDNVPGSVGRPLPGIDVKLTGEGELMVRSPSLMSRYWKDDAGTARALDPAGWLATGDLAEIADGRIFIRGRMKEIIILSIGEKVNPNVVEAEITRDALFEQVVVVGNSRPFLAALIVLGRAAWQRVALDNGLDPERPNEPASKTRILARIEPLLATLPRFAQVRAVHLMLEPWTIEAGLLTPTLKVKREVVQRIFATEIDALYAEQEREDGRR